MIRPIVRNMFEYGSQGEGYILFGKVSGVAEREAEVSESNVITLHKNESSNMGCHPDEEEVYYYISGEGKIALNGKEYPVKRGSVAFIPRGCTHISTCTSDEDLCYTCVAVYYDLFKGSKENNK